MASGQCLGTFSAENVWPPPIELNVSQYSLFAFSSVSVSLSHSGFKWLRYSPGQPKVNLSFQNGVVFREHSFHSLPTSKPIRCYHTFLNLPPGISVMHLKKNLLYRFVEDKWHNLRPHYYSTRTVDSLTSRV